MSSTEERVETVARLASEAAPMVAELDRKLRGALKKAKALGVGKIGGFGAFAVSVELVALGETIKKLASLHGAERGDANTKG